MSWSERDRQTDIERKTERKEKSECMKERKKERKKEKWEEEIDLCLLHGHLRGVKRKQPLQCYEVGWLSPFPHDKKENISIHTLTHKNTQTHTHTHTHTHIYIYLVVPVV